MTRDARGGRQGPLVGYRGAADGGAVRRRTGTLYTALARMLKLSLIEETGHRPDPEDDDERRRYYAIIPFGRDVAAAEAARMRGLVAMATRNE